MIHGKGFHDEPSREDLQQKPTVVHGDESTLCVTGITRRPFGMPVAQCTGRSQGGANDSIEKASGKHRTAPF